MKYNVYFVFIMDVLVITFARFIAFVIHNE